MSRRKQANPQHVHETPGPDGKVSGKSTNVVEVLAANGRALTNEPEAESNKGILQNDSSSKQSTQQLSESPVMEGNANAPSPGKKELSPENSLLFPANLTNDQPMSHHTQFNPVQADEDASSCGFSPPNVTVKDPDNLKMEQVQSCEISRKENSFQESAQENHQEEAMENEVESMDVRTEEGSSQSDCQSTNDQEGEMNCDDPAADEDDVNSVNISSPRDDVTRSTASNKSESSLRESELEEHSKGINSRSFLKEDLNLNCVKTETGLSNPNGDDVMHTSPDDEKENMNSGGMMNGMNSSQQFIYNVKLAKESTEERKELSDIRDQMRMLQQQQAYQVQMLNYLHVQLTLLASNPQAQKVISNMFQSQGLNGFQLQNMPHLLSSSGAAPGGSRPSEGGFLPSMAAAIGRQLSSGNPTEFPQSFDMLNDMRERKQEFGQAMAGSERSKANNETEAGHEAYNPLSSLSMLQKSSSIRPNGSEMFSNLPQNGLDENSTDTFMNHACRFCHKIFGSDSALQIHLRSHTGERPFKCNICANRFSTKGNLKVHFVRHKDKYPNIEMNVNPVPEYLDDVPTSSGIPYGMSILPDEEDTKRFSLDAMDGRPSFTDLNRAPAELPVPYQSVDGLQRMEMSHQDEDNSENVQDDDRSNSSLAGDERNGLRQQDAIEGHKKVSTPEPLGPALSCPKRQDISGLSEEQAKAVASFLPKMTSSSPASSRSRKPWEEHTTMREIGPNGKPAISSSETTKLQQLVEQIDRSKELDKNECHICHRILSCQSALKLHYRTHTGERPFKCDLCSRAFTTRGNLRTHYSSVHRQQLRSTAPENTNPSRGSSLQCPLCFSHFLNQQSMQQHMQMHIYMHNQQQQQAAQMMTNNGSRVDYRMLGMMGGGFPPNFSVTDKDTQESEVKTEPNQAENDDVFEDNVPNRNRFSKAREGSVETSGRFSGKNSLEFTQQKNTDEQYSTYLQSDHASSQRSPANEKEDDAEKNAENGALDLSRPGSNSSSSTIGVKRSSPTSSLQGVMNASSPTSTASSSLSALASLASNGPVLRPNGLSSINAHMTSVKEEARARKMTTACEICSKPFTCQSALEIHLRSHTKERPFVCRVCDRRFTTKGNLKQHLLTHDITDVDDEMLEPVFSPSQGNSSPSSPSNSPSLTNGAYPMKRPLEASQSAPAAKRSYPRHWCHICQKQFSSASSLQIHNRTHTGEKPFACSVCGRAFTTKGNLKVHMGTHVWGAGGSRRGRRISMDNPLISPWMQNTSVSNMTNPPLRPRASPQVPVPPEQAAIYQQYAALASGLMGAKAAADARLHGNQMMNFNNAAVRLLMPNNLVSNSPITTSSDDKPSDSTLKESNNNAMTNAATEWIWKAYQQTQEQVN